MRLQIEQTQLKMLRSTPLQLQRTKQSHQHILSNSFCNV